MKTTLIVPTLNEAEGIKAIMPRVKPEWCEQIIMLDPGSTDGSQDIARSMGYEVFEPDANTLWDEYRELFLSGIIKGDIVITFSPDGNSVPEGIPMLIAAIEVLGHDMVIGSRYVCGAKSEDDTIITGFGNWLFNKLINILCRARYTDALVMMRGYRTEIAEQLGFLAPTPKVHKFAQRFSGLSSWEPPLSIRASKAKLRVAEVPIDEPANEKGRRQHWLIHGFVILMQILYEGLIRRSI